MDQLEKAISIATHAHAGQTDAQGKPYILHPLRVMMAAVARGYDEHMQAAAVLHDVLEDCQTVEARTLRNAGISEDAICMVEYLTRPSESCAYYGCIARYDYARHFDPDEVDFDHAWRSGGGEQPYVMFIAHIATHPRASRIKLLDIDDNEGRLEGIADDAKAVRLFSKYRQARRILEAALQQHGGR